MFRVLFIFGFFIKKVGILDSVDDIVSYVEVYEIVKEIVEGMLFKLIEVFVEKIVMEVLIGYFLLEEVIVKFIKLNFLILGYYDFVVVEIECKRSDLNG